MKKSGNSKRRPEFAVWIAGLVALGGAAAYAAAGYRAAGRLGLPLDDSWIHLQFARSLAAGTGMAFEPGEWVSGSTAPLWTAILALLSFLPGSAVAWSQLVGTALFVLGTVVFHHLCRDLGMGRGVATLASLLFATSGPLVWSAVSGLEIPLFVLLSMVGCRLHLRDRDTGRGLALSLPVLALAALARPEGLLLLMLALADRGLALRFRWREWWGGAWSGLLLGALVLLPIVVFNVWTSASALPTTFAAKSAGLGSPWPSLRYLHTVLGILFRDQPYMTLLAGGGALILGQRLYTARDRGLLPALWVIALPLAYSTMSSSGSPLVGNFGRYHYPLLPFLIALGGLAMAAVVEAWSGRSGSQRRAAYLLAALLVLWPTLSHWRTTAGQFAQNVHDVETGDAAAARWLGERLAPGDTLAVNDIGVIKYLLPQHRIYDLAGIVTPEVHGYTSAALARGEPWEAGIARYLEVTRPDYLVVFPSWFPGLAASGVSFQPIAEFKVAGNITLGGDRLVIYRTPWTSPETAE